MWTSRHCADYARCHRLAAVENFDVNLLRRHAHSRECLFHVCHEPSRPAEVDIRISWDADLIENRSRQVTASVEVLTHPVIQSRLAVTNMAAAVRERTHEAADFIGERMMSAIASRVHPQDLSCRASRRQRVQHRQNWRRADSRAEQHQRPVSGLQNEASPRRADVESIAHPDMLSQVGSSHRIRLDLHADSVAFRRKRARERVAAKTWRAVSVRLKTHDDVLACQSSWQLLIVGAL